ncbi:hypothetical protein OSB04_013217 [Centaurea solstitialis]|uniref:F-box domain-containing protein n=1 Tax=Centaurea solstitialis TaxID=347529 RepID=A0AA38TKD7_9ASTR|nr:hypothetical protein OSB04_013217 [Centaurea solstitialis]
MAVELPDELIVEILSFLPAKSLLRCRSVCKSWLNLISSTKFKPMHFHNFNQLNPRYFVRRVMDFFVVEVLYDEAFTLDCGTQIELPFCIRCIDLGCRIIGCCNGVVCLYNDEGGGYFDSDTLILWNPSIRRILPLPLPIFNVIQFEDSFVVVGFGYDNMSDDYKVVRLGYNDYYELLTRPRAEVYTLKTGIWREVMFPDDLCCFYIQYNWTQVFSNGCVHWIAHDPTPGVSHNSIMTFDITTERFGEILLPDDLLKVDPRTMMISVVGESLAVTYDDNLIDEAGVMSSTYKVWVMKEYKNPTSWTLMYNMHYPDIDDMGIPLQVQNKGDMIMESRDGNIILYNYSGHAFCICPGYVSLYKTYVDKYQESLALLDVGYSDSSEEVMEALLNM